MVQQSLACQHDVCWELTLGRVVRDDDLLVARAAHILLRQAGTQVPGCWSSKRAEIYGSFVPSIRWAALEL
jgi:hypothetical protein